MELKNEQQQEQQEKQEEQPPVEEKKVGVFNKVMGDFAELIEEINKEFDINPELINGLISEN